MTERRGGRTSGLAATPRPSFYVIFLVKAVLFFAVRVLVFGER